MARTLRQMIDLLEELGRELFESGQAMPDSPALDATSCAWRRLVEAKLELRCAQEHGGRLIADVAGEIVPTVEALPLVIRRHDLAALERYVDQVEGRGQERRASIPTNELPLVRVGPGGVFVRDYFGGAR